ncbi:hypothetical protein [Selenomonas sp. AE3005]|uniref:hypothetical protein n=1 Tax=Selenomonas sp. AE3005 TaxID=1485543 RepID=UPI000A9A030E|nr:hypothetical protein [Selenomonas sp. AE3005]
MNSLFLSYVTSLYYTKIKPRFSKAPVLARFRPFMYKNRIVCNKNEAHSMIASFLESGRPCMIARYGFTEAQLLGRFYMKYTLGFDLARQYKRVYGWLYDTAGFFSKNHKRVESDVDKFCNLMIDASKNVDVIGAHCGMLEDYVINKCCPNDVNITLFDNLAIFIADKSWGRCLKGKRVLLVHPFADTIQRQYKKRMSIWGGRTDILPDFELLTYKAIQTIAGNNVELYEDWFTALDIMINDIKKIDFDIAIIGCGAYGFPLASEIKNMGKKAVHLGGQTQVIFGILGKRYDSSPALQKYINESWVRPDETEKPKNYKDVEGGCYW